MTCKATLPDLCVCVCECVCVYVSVCVRVRLESSALENRFIIVDDMFLEQYKNMLLL